MVTGTNSEIEDEIQSALDSSSPEAGAKPKKGKGVPRKAKGVVKSRGPCRPYKKLTDENLDKIIDQLQTRYEATDAKVRMLSVRLKAYRAEKSMRDDQDVAPANGGDA